MLNDVVDDLLIDFELDVVYDHFVIVFVDVVVNECVFFMKESKSNLVIKISKPLLIVQLPYFIKILRILILNDLKILLWIPEFAIHTITIGFKYIWIDSVYEF